MDMSLLTQELFTRLGRIEEKLDRVVRLEERQDRSDRDLADVTERVDSIEEKHQELAARVGTLTDTSTYRWGTFTKVFFGVLAFCGFVGAPVLAEVALIKLGVK